MNLEKMLKPAAIGGILLGVLSLLPVLECACCAWMIGGGVLAAYLYVKKSSTAVTLGEGAILGILTGIIGTIVIAIFQIPLFLMSPENSREFADLLLQRMEQMPWYSEENQEAFFEFTSREGFVKILYIASVGGYLVVDCLLAMLGGPLGVAIFEKRKPGYPSAQDPENEPPSTLLPPPPPDE